MVVSELPFELNGTQHTNSDHTNYHGCMLHEPVIIFMEHISDFSEVYLVPDDDELYRVQHKTNRKLH